MYNVTKGKQEFWTAFGQYMAPVLSAEGDKINWVNYKTGIKHIYFRTDAGRSNASIAIELRHPDPVLQQEYMGRLLRIKNMFTGILNEEWIWQTHLHDQQPNSYSRIFKEIRNVNVFRQEDWPVIISFFKPRLIALDEFWSQAKHLMA